MTKYKYREQFIPSNGYRLFRDKRSVLIGAIGYGRPFTEEQHGNFAKHINKYLDAVLERTPLAPTYGRPLTLADFPDLKSELLYKYISDSTWKHISGGSIQLGTAEHYRTTPNIKIQDQREGASMFHLTSGNNQLHVAITSGFNCALFCGTSYAEGPDHELMLARFGRKRIKIDPLPEFISCIGKHLGALNARAYDVVYTDLKNYVAHHDGIERFMQIADTPKLDRHKLRKINETFFSTLYDYGFLPSLFAKPTSYKEERERRIVFELRDDLRKSTVVVEDKSLLDYITIVDT